MQDKKLLNITHAVVGEQGVYSIEFHEDDHTTHVKRANGDMSETLFTLGGSGGGSSLTAGNGIQISNGVISSTYDWSLFADTGDVDPVNSATPLTIAGGTNVTTSISGNTLTIDAASFTEENIIPYTGGTINTDTVSLYGLREGAEKLVLARTVSSDTDFVLQGGTSILGTANFGIITVQVTINCTGTGGILLKYKDLSNNNVNVRGGVAQTSGNIAITFAYFGATGLQLLQATEF